MSNYPSFLTDVLSDDDVVLGYSERLEAWIYETPACVQAIGYAQDGTVQNHDVSADRLSLCEELGIPF